MPSFIDKPVASLGGHGDSVTTANFSPNGAYLASGSEGGLMLIHSVTNWRRPLLRFIGTSPITSSTWHPRLQGVFFCGCKSGDIYTVRFSASGVRSCYLDCDPLSILTFMRTKDVVNIWTDPTKDQIHCLAHHDSQNILAVGCGNEVSLVTYKLRGETHASWANTKSLPSPPQIPGYNGFLPKPIARSVNFLKRHRLIVAYLDHGVV